METCDTKDSIAHLHFQQSLVCSLVFCTFGCISDLPSSCSPSWWCYYPAIWIIPTDIGGCWQVKYRLKDKTRYHSMATWKGQIQGRLYLLLVDHPARDTHHELQIEQARFDIRWNNFQYWNSMSRRGAERFPRFSYTVQTDPS